MMLFTKLLKFLLNSGRAAQKGFTMASTAGAIALTAVLLATTSNSLLSLVKKESQINNANISKARMLLTAQALAVYKYGPGADGDEYRDYAGDEGGVAYVPVGDNVTTHTGMSSQSNYKANVPNIPGVPASDGWGNKFQYCVWGYANNDSSNKTDITGAMNDGSFAKLIGHHVGAGGSNYEDIKAHYIMALISAGPDGTIDTNCNTHIQECTSASSVDACTQKMATASGGAQNDDMVYAIPFFEWDMMARDAYVETSNLPIAVDACDEDTEKLHWDGTAWSCVASPSVTDVTNILTCNDDGQVWDKSANACVSAGGGVDLTKSENLTLLQQIHNRTAAETFASKLYEHGQPSEVWAPDLWFGMDTRLPSSTITGYGSTGCATDYVWIGYTCVAKTNSLALSHPTFLTHSLPLTVDQSTAGTNQSYLQWRQVTIPYAAASNYSAAMITIGIANPGDCRVGGNISFNAVPIRYSAPSSTDNKADAYASARIIETFYYDYCRMRLGLTIPTAPMQKSGTNGYIWIWDSWYFNGSNPSGPLSLYREQEAQSVNNNFIAPQNDPADEAARYWRLNGFWTK